MMETSTQKRSFVTIEEVVDEEINTQDNLEDVPENKESQDNEQTE